MRARSRSRSTNRLRPLSSGLLACSQPVESGGRSRAGVKFLKAGPAERHAMTGAVRGDRQPVFDDKRFNSETHYTMDAAQIASI